MTSPQPPSALDGRCSAIYDNTLYVYTSSALLSLPLESGAEWNSLDAGQSVTGAVCVTGNIDDTSDDQALYVVGGAPLTTRRIPVFKDTLLAMTRGSQYL